MMFSVTGTTTDDGTGTGAAHGGHGGAKYPQRGGTAYNSVFTPAALGSGGGNGSGEGGRGGGYLVWSNGKLLTVDGLVTVHGHSGVGLGAGGGSGGSILITTLNFTGYGLVEASGGHADNSSGSNGGGGGGAGGRIAVHIRFANKFGGRLRSVGGRGQGQTPSGAAGTGYIEETARGPQYADIKYNKDANVTYTVATHRRLEIDNENLDVDLYANHAEPWLYTVIQEGGKDWYDFDEGLLTRHSNLMIDYPTGKSEVAVAIHKFYGDRTGLVHIRANQKLYAEVVESEAHELVAPCSFRIDADSELLMPDGDHFFGTRTVLAGRLTGAQDVFIRDGADILFRSTAQTALIENGTYTMMTQRGNFTFAELSVNRYSRGEFSQITDALSITSAKLFVRYQSELIMNAVSIFNSHAQVQSQGVLHLNGRGEAAERGIGAATTTPDGVGKGAAHGGYGGGPGPDYGGDPYGSVFRPTEYGSGGGNGSGEGGRGGGRLFWDVAGLIEVDGLLAAYGNPGAGTDAGGGSGGSILIRTTNITGHGVMSVKGGEGQGRGGGGSGGRIGVHCRWRYQYGGRYENYGGLGQGQWMRSHAGAAGTTYIEENLRELEYRHKKYDPVLNTTFLAVDHTHVHADNNYAYSPAPTMLMDPGRFLYELNELELLGSTRLLIYHSNISRKVEVVVHAFIGDKTGQVHLRHNQKLFAEVVESVLNRTEAPCGFIIDRNAELVLPGEFHVHGTNGTIAGTITGVHELYVERSALMVFESTANTAFLQNGSYVRVTAAGTFAWDTLHVKRGGECSFLKVTEVVQIEVSEMRVKFWGLLFMNHARVFSTFAWIESKGVFHLDGGGDQAEDGQSPGATIDGVGYGAGHGGQGGGSNVTLLPGAFGSVYTAQDFGSGGGNGLGVGGKGGGVLYWNTSHYMELNGLLAAQGLSGSGQDSGGGSGGSVWIETMNITGHGEIRTHGGDGVRAGGGGAGGRISVRCQFRFSFGGRFTNAGGSGGAGFQTRHGGAAGTTYVQNNRRPLEYRILKYMEGTNTTYFEVDHRYLHSDNEGRWVQGVTVVRDFERAHFEFNVTEITGYSRVNFYKQPQKQRNATLIVIHALTGDRTGQLHLLSGQKALVEYVESVSNVTEAPCSYNIDYGSEVIFPTEVHFQGVNSTIEGKVTGVHHFYIEDGAFVNLDATAETAFLENGTYFDESGEGNFSVYTLNIKGHGELQLTRILHDLTITASFVELKYSALLSMNHGFFEVGDMDMETQSTLDLDGRGHAAETGPGAGTLAGGGSYGGQGGRDPGGGTPYGSLFSPTDLGSGGGGAGGGAGGGYLNLGVGRQLHVDGHIHTAGASGEESTNAGGGSGGTIFIHAFNFSGHGVLDARGGNATGTGGAGSGGRIAAHIDFSNDYGGGYVAHGGWGQSGDSGLHGGPGTVYKYESNHGPQYRDLKYNPRLNATELKPDHIKLTVDNGDLRTTNPALVMESDALYYYFDEVQVEGYSYVHFYHPAGADNVTVVVQELTGNKKGMVRVQDRQHVVVNFVESTHTYLDAPCGLHVDRGGELILPTQVVILAQSFVLGGRLEGTEELTLERGSRTFFRDGCHTNLRYKEQSLVASTPGRVYFTKLNVHNDADLVVEMNPINTTITAPDLIVKKGGELLVNSQTLTVNATDLTVRSGGTIVGDGSGYGGSSGPGVGGVSGDSGSGGGHAGRGESVRMWVWVVDVSCVSVPWPLDHCQRHQHLHLHCGSE